MVSFKFEIFLYQPPKAHEIFICATSGQSGIELKKTFWTRATHYTFPAGVLFLKISIRK